MSDKELDDLIRNRRFTMLELYGRASYHKHIDCGDRYYYLFMADSEEARLAGKGKVLITITGTRSGVAFYTIEGHPEKEFHFDLQSAMGAFLEPEAPDRELIRKMYEEKEYMETHFI
jgi:hypothetical protein